MANEKPLNDEEKLLRDQLLIEMAPTVIEIMANNNDTSNDRMAASLVDLAEKVIDKRREADEYRFYQAQKNNSSNA